YYTFDGEWTNQVTGRDVGDEETTAINGVIDWSPVDNVSFRLRGAYQEDRDGTRAFFLQPTESNNCFPGTRSNAAWNGPFGGTTNSTNNNQYFCGEISGENRVVSVNDGPDADGVANLVPGIPDQPTPGVPAFIVPGFPGGDDPYDPAQGVAFSGVERDLTYLNFSGDWDIMGSGYNLIGSIAYRNDELATGSDSDHSAVNLASPFAGPSDLSQSECLLCASEIDDATDVTMELRIESPGDQRLTWMLGGFYYGQEIDGSDIVWAPSGAPATTVTGVLDTEETTNIAAFGMLEYAFLEDFSMALELRWFDEEKTLVEGKDLPTPSFDGKASFSEWAPRVSANWDVTDNSMLYAIYAKGYKPGGLNGDAGAGVGAPTYGQEEADTYELGLKTVVADGRVYLNAALFFNQLDKIQLTTPLSSAGGQLTSIVTNQGDGEVKGVELEFGWAILDNLNLGMSYALADTRFTEGCDKDQWVLTSGGGVLTDAQNCTGNNVNGQGNGSIVGSAFPLASKNQFSANLDWTQQISGEMEFFTNVDYTWEDKKPVQVHNQAWVPENSILNARLGIGTDRWQVAIYGRNLTEEDAPSMATRWLQEPNFFGRALASTSTAGAPAGSCPPGACETTWPRAFFADFRRSRNFGIEASYRFGGR
ncbi:MAG: TonB-dependent receptor, partial [Gammaproteobacteria bacterium]